MASQRKVDEDFVNYFKNGNPDPGVVREMIAQGCNVHTRDRYFNTVLHLAMRYCYNKLAVVSVLLNAGANPNSTNVFRKTPLQIAIKCGQEMPVINELIKFGANINLLDGEDNSALHCAVANFRQPVVDAFLKLKADVNIKNSHGNNVLHQCVLCDDLYTIRKILQSKDYSADINAKNNNDETPLMLAVKSGNYEIVKELLSFEASVLIPDKYGSSLLHAALKKPDPNLNLIGELVRYDADICSYDMELSSPLHLALDRYFSHPSDKLETAKTLLIYDALRNSDRTAWCKSNIGSKYGGILPELLEFYKKCLDEVKKMKSELIHGNYSFLEFVIEGLNNKALFQKRTIYKTSTVNQILHICKEYPIYRKIIASRLEKIDLRSKLMDIDVYVQKENECKIFLDLDSVFTLSHYLTNLDLLNLIEAFSDLQAPCQDFGSLTLSSRKPEKRKYDSDH
ncbi:ANK_REP_REGION domain-containing protein [Trichonephila inaurata madagascariensis]|uniref:ANK_REP_REGION domain-containing protein n=1 Tax=Trichonephila inaurata madagascariensis TaxID=2747483 RepID=A0A8X6YR98_9ARAC|nr:ANK_REP_REGION domain-containing protein [Trichonephila inaurata madagascariensis]